MKRNIMKLTGIAMISALAFTACHKEKVKEEALLAGLLSQAVRTAGQGNCAININLTGLSYGTLVQAVVGSATVDAAVNGGKFLTHFNNVNASAHTVTTLNALSYNRKYDTFFTDKDTWNDAARATYLRAAETAIEAGTLGATLQGQYAAVKGSRGSAIMACARIPKSSCSFSALTTATRTKDLENQVSVYNTIASTSDCKKTGNIEYALKTNLFNGAYVGQVFSFADGSTFTPVNDGTAATSNSTSTSILAEKSYPKFGTLVSLGFGQLMPMVQATAAASTAYGLTTDAYTQGSNITATEIVSCEAIGLPSGGPTVTAALPLTPVKEVAYSFSTQGQAASAYAAARTTLNGPTLTNGSTATAATETAFNEAVACNNGLRNSFAPPLAIGGGKMGDVTGTTGDGGSTTLLTACIYGLTSAGRATPIAVIGATLAGISHCPAAASTGVGSVKFADTGLQTLSDFPNN